MRRAFTIIELMAVIAIIALLATIVIVAAGGALKNARSRRADSTRVALEQAISAYYAQEGKWPSVIETKADQPSDNDVWVFSATDNDRILQEVVGKGFGKSSGMRSQLIDASALVVARASDLGNSHQGCFDNHGDRTASDYCGDKRCIAGRDFMMAANRNSKYHIPFSAMAFGYAGPVNGKFCRFWITYNYRTDAVTVSLKKPK